MHRTQYYAIMISAAAVVYAIIGFIAGWDGGYAIVGALIIGLLTILGRLVPIAEGTGRVRNRDR